MVKTKGEVVLMFAFSVVMTVEGDADVDAKPGAKRRLRIRKKKGITEKDCE